MANPHGQIVLGRTQAVDAGHAGHNQDIPARQDGQGGGMAHLVDHFIDRGIFLNIGVAGGDIGFGLVIIIIADKIFHGVIRETASGIRCKAGRPGSCWGR